MTTKKTAKTETTPENAAKTVRRRAVELQKRALERQKSMFDTTFDAVTTFQERREDAFNNLLEKSRFVPKEIRLISQTWTENARTARESYRASVDKSFDLLENWVQGLAVRRAS